MYNNLNSADVREMYESNEVKAGEIISDGWLHYGYFDKTNPDATLAAGSEKFSRIMIEKTPIGAGQRFCDIGCGIGIPGIMLVKEKRCILDGMTISAHQQQTATLLATEAGVGELASFYQADALALPFDAHSYDGGWFFESISHMGHEDALQEAKRVLKSGALLLIADFITHDKTSRAFMKYAREEVHSNFISLDKYHRILKKCGFEVLELNDVTEHVGNPFPQKFQEAFMAHKEEIKHLVGEKEIQKWLDIHQTISENTGYITLVTRAL
ncbi:MAG: class I SAM-dependent methyltransferase [Deltaproteobacteria bacterium]|jgi:cyclopropane fatty-acyl-phospholipid synthase-like methyltransferase|nr:class I SAM-dependent methyltransferase [Deltaproteobacteria bacterium]